MTKTKSQISCSEEWTGCATLSLGSQSLSLGLTDSFPNIIVVAPYFTPETLMIQTADYISSICQLICNKTPFIMEPKDFPPFSRVPL